MQTLLSVRVLPLSWPCVVHLTEVVLTLFFLLCKVLGRLVEWWNLKTYNWEIYGVGSIFLICK